MNVLILSDEPCEALVRTLLYLEKTDKTIKVQQKRASQYLPTSEPGLNIHVGVPCRIALQNQNSVNILAVGGPYPEAWEWIEHKMDLVVHNLDIETTLPHLSSGKTFRESVEVWRKALKTKKTNKANPKTKIDKVSIVTLTHNRTPWWPNMVQNVLTQTWPQRDIEWIIVDDATTLGGQVAQLQKDYPDLTVKYIQAPNDIRTKRNAGVEVATSDIVLFMDDDDHYPKESVELRVKGLEDPTVNCVYCATLPIYDIRHYESSMLGPTVQKLPHLRASDASLAFRKSFWLSKGIKGNERETVELSPAGIIVAFLHNGNPKASFGSDEKPTEPNGCHYGFSEKYFTYLHQIGM